MPFINDAKWTELRKLLGDTQGLMLTGFEASSAARINQILAEADAEVATQALRDKAHEIYGSDDIEIDDEGVGTAEADGGIWVAAWVWVADED